MSCFLGVEFGVILRFCMNVFACSSMVGFFFGVDKTSGALSGCLGPIDSLYFSLKTIGVPAPAGGPKAAVL